MPEKTEKKPADTKPAERPKPKVDLGPDHGGMWEKREGHQNGVEYR